MRNGLAQRFSISPVISIAPWKGLAVFLFTLNSLLAIVLFAISGCATQSQSTPPYSVPNGAPTAAPPPPPQPAPSHSAAADASITVDSGGKNSVTETSVKVVRITPLTLFASSFASDPSARYSGTYTRLIVTSIVPGDSKESNPLVYDYTSRNALERYFFGATHTINLTAKVTVGAFTATVPLVTVGHVSNSTDGESFTRIVYHLAENYPLFLIKADGSNSVVSVQFAVKASDQYQTNAAALIQTAQTVIKAVAPQSAVLTTLTAQATKDVATALDTTISKLLATSIDEEPWVDNDIRRWAKGARVTFYIPIPEGTWDQKATFLEVGTWTVTFAAPRPSIFSDVEICIPTSDKLDATGCASDFTAAAKQAQDGSLKRPEEVLAFQLVNGAQTLGTVGAYLKQQDFWTTAQKAFQAKDGPKAEDVSQLCRSIKTSIAGLNLNSVDAGIVVVALRKSPDLAKAVVDLMVKDTPNCDFAT